MWEWRVVKDVLGLYVGMKSEWIKRLQIAAIRNTELIQETSYFALIH